MSTFDKDNDPKKLSKQEKDCEFVHDEGVMKDDDLMDVHYQLLREQAEPTEQMAPVPVFLMFMIGMLLFWCGFYLSSNSGQFRGDVFDPNWLPGADQAAEEKPFDPLDRGAKLYARTCQQCHKQNGQGLPGVYPPLDGSPWVTTDPARPVKILLKGLSGPVTVLGKQYNGNMPPVGDWKDRDIGAVLTFVRQNWSNSADPISEEFVKQIRDEIDSRNKPWSAEELLAEHPF